MKYITKNEISEMEASELKNCFSAEPISYKDKILSYMKSAPVVAATTALVTDYLTKEQFYKANNAHSDGAYQWYEDEIYHFEKYNLKLSDDFIQHVLNNS